jgi:4-hydroxy-2-oxoheptanedioate aldolase
MRGGERLTGTFVQSRDPSALEFLGRLGFDLLCIEAEHTPMGAETVQALVAAADLAPLPALVRVAANEPLPIAAALEAGAAGVVVPRVESAAEAAAAVAASRYSPAGTRGVGPSRATGFGARLGEYVAAANAELLLAIQVETRAAVESLDELLAVDAVDMIFVGPADLGFSYGITDPSSPRLWETIERVLERARAAGRLTGIYAPTPADANRWRAAGVDLVLLGTDLALLARGVADSLAELETGAETGAGGD